MTLPSAPQDVVATAGDGEVVLEWSPAANDGGSNILPPTTAWTDAGTALTATVDSLTNGRKYAFEVPVSDLGAGTTATETATPATVPGAPRHFSTTPGDGRIGLTWQAPANADTSAISRNEYRYAAGASVPAVTGWTSAGQALTVTVDSLTNGTDYTFEVRAFSAVGAGEPAAVTSAPAVEATAPTAPRGLFAASGDRAVTLTWDVPASNGGTPVRGYEYRHAEGPEVPEDTDWQSAGLDLTVTIGSLDNGTDYAFEVRAANDIGKSGAARIEATPAVAPGAPRNLTGTPADGEISLTWEKPSDDGGSPVIDYQFRFAEGTTVPADAAWYSTGKRTRYTKKSLSNGTAYTFEVRAVSAAGEGEIAALTATPAVQATAPGAPQSLEAEPGNGQVKLTWAAPASDGGSAVTGYEYRYAQGDTVPPANA